MSEDINKQTSPDIDTDYESIVPWNGEHDTGYDARTKLDRNFAKIKNALLSINNKLDNYFSLLIDSNGVQYLHTKFSLVTMGGLTAFATPSAVVPSIFDGLPLDNVTIWKNPETGLIEVIGGTGGGGDFDATAMWAALSSATNEQINKSHLTDAFNGYATESWVEDKGYALQTSLDAVSTKLNDFLEGSDTDTIINKWKELEAFLSGMQETDNLAEILSNKADTSYVNTEFSKYVTLDTEQSINGQKTFVKTIYQGSSLANRRAISFVDTSNNAIFADIKGRTIFRGNLLSFQIVNGTDIAKINDNGLYVGNVIESNSSVKSLDLYINGVHVYKENDVLFIDGDLAVTGGVTAYAQGSRTPSTILDGLVIDETTLSKEGGKLSVIGGVGGASNWDELEGKPSWIGDTKPTYSWSEILSKPTTLSGYGITDGVNAVTTTGTGNAITSASVSGHTVTLTKDSTFSLSNHTHTFASLTSKPTTLSGYGITDGVNMVSITGSGNAITSASISGHTITLTKGSTFSYSTHIHSFSSLTNKPTTVDGYGITNAVTTNTLQDIEGQKTFKDVIYQTYNYNDYKRAISYVDANKNLIFGDTNANTFFRGKQIKIQNENGVDTLLISSTQVLSNQSIYCKSEYIITDGWFQNTVAGKGLHNTAGNARFYYEATFDGWKADKSILTSGGITCYASDKRAKTIIENIKLSLKQIANAPTIRFKWNNWKIKDDGKTHIGGIAQYMQKLLPETVLKADDMLNMDYATTGYIFAVQTARYLLKTDTEVEKLKKRVKRLEKQLKQLGYEEANIMDNKNLFG